MTEQDDFEIWREAFIQRAGFRWKWVNLESWARRMVEQAYAERKDAGQEKQMDILFKLVAFYSVTYEDAKAGVPNLNEMILKRAEALGFVDSQGNPTKLFMGEDG